MLTVLFRAILLYILVIFALRLMGKRQLGELQPTELVITILISNIASLPIEDPGIPMMMGAIPIFVLVGFELLVSNLSLKSRSFRKFISGNPIVIIKDGVIDQKALHNLRFSVDDLRESLREQNVFDISEVHFAIVETTGKVSVLQKFESQNVTPKMLRLNGENQNPPAVVISDGKIISEAFTHRGISEDWLRKILIREQRSPSDIFIMTVDEKLNYLIVPKEEAK